MIELRQGNPNTGGAGSILLLWSSLGVENLPTSLLERGEDVPPGDTSCRESGRTLIICLGCIEEVAHTV